jgi:anti-sigma-K factor RskA
MMAYSEDHIALAAEYALGTLDADERAQVETMMAVDTEFTAIVHAWEYRLGVLNQMVGSVEPRPIVWENIKAAIGHSTAAGAAGAAGGAAASAAEPPAEPLRPPWWPGADGCRWIPIDNSNVIPVVGPGEALAQCRFRRDRACRGADRDAGGAGLSAGSVAGRASAQAAHPGGRGQDAGATARASAQYVALLQRTAGSPAFILTVDAATKNFTVRKVGADAEPGKSFELWLISDKLPQPRSLGVIGGSDFTARPVLASYDAGTINSATYAVTVEQAGGSPDGKPHSTPIFTGKLIETVPAARRASPHGEDRLIAVDALRIAGRT